MSTLILLVFSSASYGVGIGGLMSIARAQKDAQNTYEKETRTFERVKAAIDKGEIKKGQAKKEITSRYGEPVVNTVESETLRDKWIYKPAKSSYFEGIKVYLYFDRDNKLDEIKVTE